MKLCAETVGVFLLILLVVCDVSVAKRSFGGRSRSKSGSTSWWGRKKTSETGTQSAKQHVKPAEPAIKKETSKVQHSSPNQPQPPQPGWNVPASNPASANTGGWKSGYQTHAAPPAYPHQHAAPPAYNGQQTWGAPPAYPGQTNYKGFGQNYQQPNNYGGHSPYGNYPQQSFGGYNPGYGGMTMGGMGMGMGGGYGSYNQHGGFNTMGMGGYGGFGGGYSPMKPKSSFFSGRTIGNVIAGMVIYNMASNLISYGLGFKRPYTVVNYYNQDPDKKVEEIKLPSNVLVLCEGNATQICGKGTQSICTQNGTVLCVATMNQASPCDQNGNQALCVNTTLPCTDITDPLCQNSTHKEKLEADVTVPCFTNLTLDVNLVDQTQTQPNTKYTYCITTMAIAGPEYKICEELNNSNDYRTILKGNYEWFLEVDGFRRNYSVYNNERPMETNGEINMPITVLTKCPDNAKSICVSGAIPTCTNFNEIMCLVSNVDVIECESKNGCLNTSVPCPTGNNDEFCKNKTEDSDSALLSMPCFANITINAPIPKFNLVEYNGTLPDLNTSTSYTYHFNYCVITLALPGSDSEQCITKEAKEKQDKGQIKT
ncbi:uncharacterized protein LOC143199575 [Rhynchophorus ferrugineus]|uniref:uncharacterized protein LOC143199575 n=1 Tax=Rhynchophorus ferrugineus TaxID=354439 RepID=UPI003FCD93D6